MAVRFGVIGCGKVTERIILPHCVDSPDVTIAALVDLDRQAAQRLAERFHLQGAGIWTDWRTMLEEAKVDAVGVCVPNHLHAEVTIAALKAKKHVIVEKPIAPTLQDADAMIDAAETNQRYLMVEQTQRFDPIHEVAYDVLRSGRLGTVTQLRGRLGHGGPEHWSATSPWFTTKAQSGGGALMDVGIHIVDLLRWLSGKEVARVCGQVKTLEKRVAVEDFGSVLLEFTDGTVGSFEASWTTRPYEVATTFYGEQGTLSTSVRAAHPVTVQFSKADGDPNEELGEEYPEIPKTSRWGGAFPYFARCIEEHRTPFVTGEEGRASLEVVLAAYESARTNRWVDLPLR